MIRVILLHTLCILSVYGDARLTRHAVTHGATEVGAGAGGLFPAITNLPQHRGRWYAVNFTLAAGSIFEAERMRRAGNKEWWIPEATVTVLKGSAALYVARQIRVHNDHLDRKVWFP